MNNIFKALSDKNRRKIIDLLKEKDLTAGEILKEFNISGASLSHHLNILKNAELVLSEKKGQFIIYSLNTTVFDEVINWIFNLKGE